MVVCISILYVVIETLWVLKTYGYFGNSAYQYTIQQCGKIFEHIYVMCMFVFNYIVHCPYHNYFRLTVDIVSRQVKIYTCAY